MARPLFVIILLVSALTGSAHAAPEDDYRRVVERQFAKWLGELWSEAQSHKISRATFDQALRGVELQWSLPDLSPPDLGAGQPPMPLSLQQDKDRQQAEFSVPSNYFPQSTLQNLVEQGKRLSLQWRDTLREVEKRYGVDSHIVLALWGRETGYGAAKLPHNAVEVLATQAFMGRRKDKFRKELLTALTILQEGHVRKEAMASSWAGAMGHTQFLPSDFVNYAVDLDGDGRRDIWRSIPDSLASAANSLRANGWKLGKGWGYEVRLPQGFDCTLEGPEHARPISEWLKLGIKRSYERSFAPEQQADKARLIAPAGIRGPTFLALENFDVLRAYNTADLYALFIGQVADRMSNNRPWEGAWQPVGTFKRSEIKTIQELMTQDGLYDDKIDGLAGGRTRAAIGKLQRKFGQPVECYPTRELVTRVMKTRIAR